MTTTIGKLIVRQVDILPEGFHSDGGSRAWVYRYKEKTRTGKHPDKVSLDPARYERDFGDAAPGA